MKKWILRGAAAIAGLAALGFAVAASGLIPITASSGHWPITAWMLKFSMRRSVATHSIGIASPENLRDPALILRGAGHYESGCAFCHGAPDRRMPPVPAAMTPHPPNLPEVARELAPEELFYIVKHGVKFTGMPAWPALHRDDEVWAVTAFLIALRDLDAAGYRALILAPPDARHEPPPLVLERCARCHGSDGQGRMPGAFPRLAGQRRDYLVASLGAYAAGERGSGMMEPIAARLTPAEIELAAGYYAELPPMQPTASERLELGENESAELGGTIANRGLPEQNLPSCIDCHGPSQQPRRELYPRLAGQQAWYLATQLELFRSGHRGGTRYVELMHEVAGHQLTDEQIAAVSAYFAGL